METAVQGNIFKWFYYGPAVIKFSGNPKSTLKSSSTVYNLRDSRSSESVKTKILKTKHFEENWRLKIKKRDENFP